MVSERASCSSPLCLEETLEKSRGLCRASQHCRLAMQQNNDYNMNTGVAISCGGSPEYVQVCLSSICCLNNYQFNQYMIFSY